MVRARERSLAIREIDLAAADRRAHRYFLETAFGDIDSASWRSGEVAKIMGRRVVEAATFAVAQGTYVCFHIDTVTRQAKGNSEMKGRDILKKIWARYYGDLNSLDVIGYWIVQNDDVRAAMENASRAYQSGWNEDSILGVWLSLYTGGPGWEEAGE